MRKCVEFSYGKWKQALICQWKFVKCETGLCRWVVKENLWKICGKFIPGAFVGAFFWSFYVAEPSDFPFQAISPLLEAF